MKMEKHNVWNSLANFLSSIPKTVSKAGSKAASGLSKSLSETSRELFFNKPKDKTVETGEDTKDVTGAKPTVETVKATQKKLTQEIETIEVSPIEVPKATVDTLKTKQVELNKEIETVKASPREVTPVTVDIPKSKQINQRKIPSNDINPRKVNPTVSSNIPDPDINRFKTTLENTPAAFKGKDFIGSTDSGRIKITKNYKRNKVLDAKVLKASGAKNIDGGTNVESLYNMGSKILSFTKGFMTDTNLDKIWPSQTITSGGRSKDNKARKPHSAHNDTDEKGNFITVQAIDIRNYDGSTKNTIQGSEKVLVDQLGPSAITRGWTIVSTKANKQTVTIVGKNHNETWMKLTKRKEVRFIEVVSGNNQHIHFHVDVNHREPKDKW